MFSYVGVMGSAIVALRKESVDRNIRYIIMHLQKVLSLSARRAWIEIIFWICRMFRPAVALRKESVDRNAHRGLRLAYRRPVALRKESVDRNAHRGLRLAYRRPSLSARRAWIEILASRLADMSTAWVALRKESVDRNAV